MATEQEKQERADAKAFIAEVKKLAADGLHEHHAANGARSAVRPSDIMAKIDQAFPTFLKLYQVAGGSLIPANAKSAADLLISVLVGIKALGDNLTGQPVSVA